MDATHGVSLMPPTFQTEVSILLRSVEEMELFNSFLHTLDYLRSHGALPSATTTEQRPLRIEEPTRDDAMTLVREYVRRTNGDAARAEINALSPDGSEPSSRDVYRHFYTLLYGE